MSHNRHIKKEINGKMHRVPLKEDTKNAIELTKEQKCLDAYEQIHTQLLANGVEAQASEDVVTNLKIAKVLETIFE